MMEHHLGTLRVAFRTQAFERVGTGFEGMALVVVTPQAEQRVSDPGAHIDVHPSVTVPVRMHAFATTLEEVDLAVMVLHVVRKHYLVAP